MPARSDWQSVRFLAVDAEMSSLDPGQGELLSLGWVEVERGAIQVASAQHVLIRPQAGVGQSATIHRLRDCDTEGGVTAPGALEALLAAASGRVLVFHYAELDLAYLDRLCVAVHGAPLLPTYLCTLRIERRLLERQGGALEPGALTLNACRRRYNLPDYSSHNALRDALATAELLLAQIASRARGARLRLRDL